MFPSLGGLLHQDINVQVARLGQHPVPWQLIIENFFNTIWFLENCFIEYLAMRKKIVRIEDCRLNVIILLSLFYITYLTQLFGNSYSNTMESSFFINDIKFCTAVLAYPEPDLVKKWDCGEYLGDPL